MLRTVGLLLGWTILPGLAFASMRPETGDGFDQYLADLEQRRAANNAAGHFLWIDGAPDLRQTVLAGQPVVRPITSVIVGVKPRVPGGEIHHTVGATFVPGASIESVRKVLHDYQKFGQVYGPEVVEARLLSDNGNEQDLFIRLRKHFVITVVLNIKCQVHWTASGPGRVSERTVSTYVGDAQNPEQPDDGDRGPQDDRGFVWRYETIWRLEEVHGGVLLEHEMIVLSRRTPVALRTLLRPILDRLPQDSVLQAVSKTRQAAMRHEQETVSTWTR